MDEIYKNQWIAIGVPSLVFVLLYFTLFLIARSIYKRLKIKVAKTPGFLDDFILDLFRIPALWMIFWILFKIYSDFTFKQYSFVDYMAHINTILLIVSITWVLTKVVKAASVFLQKKLDINKSDNLTARKSLTQIKVFQGIANTVIVIIAISVSLMTFSKARTIGLSLITSAGVFGIIIGFAAQKSIGMILAGIQIAITQPIRLFDVVIVENEWGTIEEINLTYVVVKIWDERRLVLPVNYFLEKPFQNWTRTSADIIGTIFLYVDYSFPVDSLRNALPDLLRDNVNWDKRVVNVQVTNTSEVYMEVRVLLSSSDASKNWDLRTDIREKLIDYVNVNYPGKFARIRLNSDLVLKA